jgi:hypothetical protein
VGKDGAHGEGVGDETDDSHHDESGGSLDGAERTQ